LLKEYNRIEHQYKWEQWCIQEQVVSFTPHGSVQTDDERNNKVANKEIKEIDNIYERQKKKQKPKDHTFKVDETNLKRVPLAFTNHIKVFYKIFPTTSNPAADLINVRW
jgi:hypothetical protein